jgi:hypothetical protein
MKQNRNDIIKASFTGLNQEGYTNYYYDDPFDFSKLCYLESDVRYANTIDTDSNPIFDKVV